VCLPIYSHCVFTWLAAIELDTGGNLHSVLHKYGIQLQSHLAFVKALQEKVRQRVKCTVQVFKDIAGSPYCNYSVFCENKMLRSRTLVRDHQQLKHDPKSILCPEPAGTEIEQENAEEENGMRALREIEDALLRVLEKGTLRNPPPLQFATLPSYNYGFLYTIDHDGELYWWKQPPSQNPNEFTSWVGPKRIEGGLGGYKLFVPAGGNRFYGVRENGDLDWFSHPGFNDGTPGLTRTDRIGNGWGDFRQLIPCSDGILYALTDEGKVLWYCHTGYKTGAKSWLEPATVVSGWNKFKSVFCVGKGILYAIAEDGQLFWYHHKGYKTGANDWEGPKPVGIGWHNFNQVFGVADGVIYGIKPDGIVFWYKHEHWETGGNTNGSWRGALLAGIGLNGYRHVLPMMPAEPDPIR